MRQFGRLQPAANSHDLTPAECLCEMNANCAECKLCAHCRVAAAANNAAAANCQLPTSRSLSLSLALFRRLRKCRPQSACLRGFSRPFCCKLADVNSTLRFALDFLCRPASKLQFRAKRSTKRGEQEAAERAGRAQWRRPPGVPATCWPRAARVSLSLSLSVGATLTPAPAPVDV